MSFYSGVELFSCAKMIQHADGSTIGKIMSLRKTIFSLAVLALAASGAAAADLKIGVINLERILSQSQSAQVASDRLNKESRIRQDEIEALTRRFKQRLEDFEKNSSSMSESEKVAERRALAEMERDVTRRSREARDEFNQKRNEEVLLLQGQVARICKDIAKKEDFDLVLYEYFYASDRVDLTNRVIEELDKNIKKK